MLVEISAEAERDLSDIGQRIARDNLSHALRFVRNLRAACLGLSEFPERFAVVQRYEPQGIRHRVCGNYLIHYRVEQTRVVVLHILHGAMDYSALLDTDE